MRFLFYMSIFVRGVELRGCMNYYLEMLKRSINRIEADFDFSAIIDHNCSKGTFREQVIKNFLRPFLPGRYGVSGGQAFDTSGEISKQLDVVVYDSLFSYIAPYMDDFIYFPCESVYGNIEIKSSLNKQSFREAAENIASLKNLKRKKIDTFYVNPMQPLIIDNVSWNITAVNEYIGIIFAYESVKAETILGYIKDGIMDGSLDREGLPNMIVLFKEKEILIRYHKCEDGMYGIHPLGQFDGYLVEECSENVLSEFLILLFIALRSIELRALDIQELSKEVHRSIFIDGKKSIKHLEI